MHGAGERSSSMMELECDFLTATNDREEGI